MHAYLIEWAATFVRVLHVLTAIGWLGASLYFSSLEQRFQQRTSTPPGAESDMWEIRGFAIFHVSKYLTPPNFIPPMVDVIQYRWTAYIAWISGFTLFVLVYYLRAPLLLIDPTVFDMPQWAAIALSMGGLAGAWISYDLLCRSALARNAIVLGCACYLLFVAFAYGFHIVFSARGVLMQLGATLGTIMLGNVVLFILPQLRRVIAGIPAGQRIGPELYRRFHQRSLHSTYLALAVVFAMVGGHFPLIYATRYSWLIVSLVVLISAAIRHAFLTLHRTHRKLAWPWFASAALFACIVGLSAIGSRVAPSFTVAATSATSSPAVQLADIKPIITERCVMCHSSNPVWPGIDVPPKGVVLQSDSDIVKRAADIERMAVLTRAMPPSNATAMTETERSQLGAWFDARATRPNLIALH